MEDSAAHVDAIIRGLRGQGDGSPDAAQHEAALLEWLVTNYTVQRSFCAPAAAAGSPSPEDFQQVANTTQCRAALDYLRQNISNSRRSARRK